MRRWNSPTVLQSNAMSCSPRMNLASERPWKRLIIAVGVIPPEENEMSM
jgi:hypothetical protein